MPRCSCLKCQQKSSRLVRNWRAEQNASEQPAAVQNKCWLRALPTSTSSAHAHPLRHRSKFALDRHSGSEVSFLQRTWTRIGQRTQSTGPQEAPSQQNVRAAPRSAAPCTELLLFTRLLSPVQLSFALPRHTKAFQSTPFPFLLPNIHPASASFDHSQKNGVRKEN